MEKTAAERQGLIHAFGNFHVRYIDEIASFDILEEAYAFFKQLKVSAALWDVSNTPYIILTKKASIEV